MDINTTDSLSIIVKKDKVENITEYYKVFGYELDIKKADKKYSNLVHLSFYRPHKIANKDRLQLYQARMECAVNNVARAEKSVHYVSTFVMFLIGFLAILSTTFGVQYTVNSVFQNLTIAIVFYSLAFVLLCFDAFCTVIIHKKETKGFEAYVKRCNKIIRVNCERARGLNENGQD